MVLLLIFFVLFLIFESGTVLSSSELVGCIYIYRKGMSNALKGGDRIRGGNRDKLVMLA